MSLKLESLAVSAVSDSCSVLSRPDSRLFQRPLFPCCADRAKMTTVLILCKIRGYCYYAYMKTILFYYLADPFPLELMCTADYLNSVAVMHILIVCLISESRSSDYNMFNVISPISLSQGHRDVLCIAIT